MKYTTIEELENYVGVDIVSTFETQMENWIEGISRYMDNITNRKFTY